MRLRFLFALGIPFLFVGGSGITLAQERAADIPYVKKGHKRHALDVYTPEKPAAAAAAKSLAVPSGFAAAGGRPVTRAMSR